MDKYIHSQSVVCILQIFTVGVAYSWENGCVNVKHVSAQFTVPDAFKLPYTSCLMVDGSLSTIVVDPADL